MTERARPAHRRWRRRPETRSLIRQSVAEHLTTVRPTRKSTARRGFCSDESTTPSSLSVAVTLKRPMRDALGLSASSFLGRADQLGRASGRTPSRLAIVPLPRLVRRQRSVTSTVPLPDDRKTPVPPVIVKFCGSFRTGSRSTHWAPASGPSRPFQRRRDRPSSRGLRSAKGHVGAPSP